MGKTSGVATLAACTASLCMLAACGGGSSSEPSEPNAVREQPVVLSPPVGPGTVPAPIPGAVTLAQYLASKPARVSDSVPAPALSDAQRQQVMQISAQRSVDVLLRAMALAPSAVNANAAAVPAVIAGHVELLRQAAAGDTLTKINTQWPPLADAAVTAALTAPMVRSMWVQTGFEPLASFLSGTDDSAPTRPLQAWSAANTDMVESAYLQSGPVFAMSAYPNTRVAVLDQFLDNAVWPEAVPFGGVFLGDDGSRRATPLIRLNSGIGLYRGSNFRADLLRQGQRTLFQIRPDPDDTKLVDFARNGRLLRALNELSQAFAPGATTLVTSGEMLLPVLSSASGRNLAAQVGPATSAALALATDEINANMKRLDGQGGTYATAGESPPQLAITSAGVSIRTSLAMSLRYSPLNVNGPGGNVTYGAGTMLVNVQVGTCPHNNAADLRSFILAQLDERSGWLWTVTLPDAGDPCFNVVPFVPG